MKTFSVLVVGLVVAGMTAVVAQDDTSNFYRGEGFSKYKTYRWDHTIGPGHTNYPVDAQITEALDNELGKKGLRKTDSDTADLSICYHAAFGTEQFNKYSDPEWEGYWFTIRTGQIAIDMYESSSKELVWRNVVDINPKAQPNNITNLLNS